MTMFPYRPDPTNLAEMQQWNWKEEQIKNLRAQLDTANAALADEKATAQDRLEALLIEVEYRDGLEKQLAAQSEELEALRGAIEEFYGDWPDIGGFDPLDIQEIGVKHGILTIEKRTTFCGSNGDECACFPCYSDKEAQAGFECYRYNGPRKEALRKEGAG